MTGYVLHRKLFDFDLAAMAAEAGAQVVTGTAVSGLLKNNGRTSGVICRRADELREIRAPVVIGADGVESRIGRWAGIDTTVALRDMETCSQVTLSDVNIETDTCVFYFSQQKFPGGYAWVFPKGDGQANVGLGIAGDRTRRGSANARLNAFVEDNFPGASILSRTVGGVPCANRLPAITAPGLLLAGDAALQANPVSGGGIATGMTAGKLAGRIAALAVKQGDLSVHFLQTYEKEWDHACGQAQKRYYRLKKGISRLSDEQLNNTAHALQKVPTEKQTLVKIFQVALAKQPSLLIDILKTLSAFSISNP
jgi:digeranylgeranylglycerophospholipid reductase